MATINQDKIFIEKKEKLRLVIQQEIGMSKVLDKIREKYKARVFRSDGEEIVFIEEKPNEESEE